MLFYGLDTLNFFGYIIDRINLVSVLNQHTGVCFIASIYANSYSTMQVSSLISSDVQYYLFVDYLYIRQMMDEVDFCYRFDYLL